MEIPLHQRQMWHGGHVAMGIVVIRFIHSSNRRTAEPITELARLDEARLLIAVIALPTTVLRLVDHVQKITHCIVLVLFAVITHGLGVESLRSQSGKRVITVVSVGKAELKGGLADGFAALGFDKPVNCIVVITADRFYLLVGKEQA